LGRPFSTDKGILVAPVLSAPSVDAHLQMDSGATTGNTTGANLLDLLLSAEQRSKASAYWAKVAMMEHASVASFSRFALELMSIGAPVDLLSSAHQAALDEVRHAQISLEIANQFSPTTLRPGALPLTEKAVIAAFGDIEKIATAAALEGYIEETLAAVIAMYQSEHMADGHHKDILRSVALDEASHAAFAWRAVHWMLTSAPPIRLAVSEVFSMRAERYALFPTDTSSPSLEHLGLLDEATMAKLQHTAWHEVVAPAATSLKLLPKKTQVGLASGQISDIIARALGSCQASSA